MPRSRTPFEEDEIRAACLVLPSVRAKLVRQRSADGVDMTDVPTGTEYIAYPIANRALLWQAEGGRRVQRVSMWVRRADRADDVGGWMPLELFELEGD